MTFWLVVLYIIAVVLFLFVVFDVWRNREFTVESALAGLGIVVSIIIAIIGQRSINNTEVSIVGDVDQVITGDNPIVIQENNEIDGNDQEIPTETTSIPGTPVPELPSATPESPTNTIVPSNTPTNMPTGTPSPTLPATLTPTNTSEPRSSCREPYPQPLYYSCFDTGVDGASFEIRDGHLYGYFENLTSPSFQSGGIYTIPVSQQARYIEFKFAILDGTENGMIALRSYCVDGNGFFLELRGNGTWTGHYETGLGDSSYVGGAFELNQETTVKINQLEGGVEISVGDVSLPAPLPCTQVGLKIELFLGANQAHRIEGYIDNFGAWSLPPQ